VITVMQARADASARLKGKQAGWAAMGAAAAAPGGDDDALKIALRPPSEREALTDQASAERWAREWDGVDILPGVHVDWEERSWARVGRQRVPVRLRLATPDAVAAFVGGEPERSWTRLRDRADAVLGQLCDSASLRHAIRKHAAELLAFEASRFDTVLDVASWLIDNPVRGLRPRQLPIRGVDTKWFKDHRSIVTHLVNAVTGEDDLGIVVADPLIRVRVLDDDLLDGGPADFAAPAAVLAASAYEPDGVFVFENLESVLAMPPWPGAIAVHGGGHAIDVVRALPWVRDSPVVYWGDLDSHGFAILHRLRSHHARVTTALMDTETLLGHRDLWVADPKPQRGTFDTLTTSERAALERLRAEGDMRMEQERIPWTTAFAQLQVAWGARAGSDRATVGLSGEHAKE